MKKETIIPLATIGLAAPPIFFGVVIGCGLFWLLSDDKKNENEIAPNETAPPIEISSEPTAEILETSQEEEPENDFPVSDPLPSARKMLREDLAEALEYGARMFTRKEAVNALQNLGFRKTAAYKAFAPGSN